MAARPFTLRVKPRQLRFVSRILPDSGPDRDPAKRRGEHGAGLVSGPHPVCVVTVGEVGHRELPLRTAIPDHRLIDSVPVQDGGARLTLR